MSPLSNTAVNCLIFFFAAFAVLLALNVFLDLTALD